MANRETSTEILAAMPGRAVEAGRDCLESSCLTFASFSPWPHASEVAWVGREWLDKPLKDVAVACRHTRRAHVKRNAAGHAQALLLTERSGLFLGVEVLVVAPEPRSVLYPASGAGGGRSWWWSWFGWCGVNPLEGEEPDAKGARTHMCDTVLPHNEVLHRSTVTRRTAFVHRGWFASNWDRLCDARTADDVQANGPRVDPLGAERIYKMRVQPLLHSREGPECRRPTCRGRAGGRPLTP